LISNALNVYKLVFAIIKCGHLFGTLLAELWEFNDFVDITFVESAPHFGNLRSPRHN
jgi:hypothetical protein